MVVPDVVVDAFGSGAGAGAVGIVVGSGGGTVCESATWSNVVACGSGAKNCAPAAGIVNAITAIAPTSTPVHRLLMTVSSLPPVGSLSAISAACVSGDSASGVRRLIGG